MDMAMSDSNPCLKPQMWWPMNWYVWLREKNILPDKRFVYYLLAAKGVCVVPISTEGNNCSRVCTWRPA